MSTVLHWLLWIGLAAIAVPALAIAVFVAAIPPAPEPPETSGHVVLGEMQWEGRTRTWIRAQKENLYGEDAAINDVRGAAYMLRNSEKYRG